MIPLRDDQPCFSTPFVNYFLIALNVLVFMFELSTAFQTRGQLNAFLYEFGVVPSYEISLLTGTPVFSPLGAFFPFLIPCFFIARLPTFLGTFGWFCYSGATLEVILATSV